MYFSYIQLKEVKWQSSAESDKDSIAQKRHTENEGDSMHFTTTTETV